MCQMQEKSHALPASELDLIIVHPTTIWCSRSPGEIGMFLFCRTESQPYDWSHEMERTQKPRVFLPILPTLSIKSGIKRCLFTLPTPLSSPFFLSWQSLVWSPTIDSMDYFNICTLVSSVSFLSCILLLKQSFIISEWEDISFLVP